MKDRKATTSFFVKQDPPPDGSGGVGGWARSPKIASTSGVAGWSSADALEAQAAAFDRDGYIVIPGALDEEHVDRLIALLKRVRPTLEASPSRKRVDIADGGRALPSNGLDVRQLVTTRDPDAASGDAARALFPFLHLLEHPSTFPIALRALGHPSISLMTSHLIVAPPTAEGTAQIGWHTDGGMPRFAGRDGVRAFTQLKVGFFLVDLPRDNMGGLAVVPGSHKLPAINHLSASETPSLDGAVQLKLKRGDAILFQQGLWHAACPNTDAAQQDRIAIYFGYGARQLRPMDFVPELLTQEFVAALSPTQRQLMGFSQTPLSYWVPQPADVPLGPIYLEHFGVPRHRE